MKKTSKLAYLLILFCLCFILPGHAEEAAVGFGEATAAMAPADLLTFVWNLLPPKVQAALIGYLAVVGLLRHAGKLITTAFHKYCETTETKADDQFLERIENSRAWRTALFWIDLLVSWKPYRGPLSPASPPPPTSAEPRPPASRLLLWMFLLALPFLSLGCTRLQPGADPLVVMTEKIEVTALATFDLILYTDDRNREFFETNAPAFHQFADWLREPQFIDGTNIWPRATAMIKQVHNVKRAYKKSRSNKDLLVAAVANLELENAKGARLFAGVTNLPNFPK